MGKVKVGLAATSATKPRIATAEKALEVTSQIAVVDPAELWNADGTHLLPMRQVPPDVRKAIVGFRVRRIRTRVKRGDVETVTIEEELVDVKLAPPLQATDQLHQYHGSYEKDASQRSPKFPILLIHEEPRAVPVVVGGLPVLESIPVELDTDG